MSAVDTLVVGGGVDGLVAALAAARAGRRAVVLEARSELGGLAGGAAFAEGYRHAGILHDTATFRLQVAKALGLAAHGLKLRPRPQVWAGGVWLTPEAVAGALPTGDAAGYRRLRTFVERVAPFAAALLDAPPPDVREEAPLWPLVKPAVGLRRLGAADMRALLKIGPTALRDWLSEHVTDGRLMAALALPALLGTWMGPMSPSSTGFYLLREALLGPQEVEGGPAALVAALASACEKAGVVLRADAPVARIAVADGTVQGATLEDGTDLYAERVVCALAPARLLDLLQPLVLPASVEAALEHVRARGIVGKVHLALSAPPSFGRREDVEHAVLAEDTVHLEHAFDDAKNGRLPSRPPPLDVRVLGGPHAPDGHRVLSILAFGVPHALRSGWDDAARQAVLEGVLSALEAHDPAIRDKVVAREVLAPTDLEARFGLPGGHLFHGEHALDQLWSLRPTPQLSGYRAPIAGLRLASSGCHPGFGLTGLPGLHAAG